MLSARSQSIIGDHVYIDMIDKQTCLLNSIYEYDVHLYAQGMFV